MKNKCNVKGKLVEKQLCSSSPIVGTMTTSGVGLVLLFIINYAVSEQSSGILSSLYKKATQENRPMVLVIDKNYNKEDDFSKNYGHSHKKYNLPVKKLSDYVENAKSSRPSNLLQYLGQHHYHLDDQHRHALSQSHELSSYRIKNPSRSRLRSSRDRRYRSRSSRDRRDRSRDSRDRSYRDSLERRDSDRDSRNRVDRDRRDRSDRDRRDRDRSDRDRRDRDDYDRRDRYRSNRDRRDRDRDSDRSYRDRDDSVQDRDDLDSYERDRSIEERSVDHTLRALIKNTLQEKQPQQKEDHDSTIRALRSSVIKNLLRAANDFNCDAKDECEDKCSKKKKVNQCEDKCAEEFECKEEEEGDTCDDCDKEDECANEYDDCGTDNKNPSTRGIIFEEEKPKCARC